jgi:hypothetical protein
MGADVIGAGPENDTRSDAVKRQSEGSSTPTIPTRLPD